MSWNAVLKIDWREIVDEVMLSDEVLFQDIYSALTDRLKFNAPTKDEVIDYLEENYEKHKMWDNIWSGKE